MSYITVYFHYLENCFLGGVYIPFITCMLLLLGWGIVGDSGLCCVPDVHATSTDWALLISSFFVFTPCFDCSCRSQACVRKKMVGVKSENDYDKSGCRKLFWKMYGMAHTVNLKDRRLLLWCDGQIHICKLRNYVHEMQFNVILESSLCRVRTVFKGL